MVLIVMILKTAFSIVLYSLVARFLAQIARADFRNPLAQTIVKITDPFLKPMRRIIPSVGGLDIAALITILLGQILLACLLILLGAENPLNIIGQLVVWGIISVGAVILTLIYWSMIIVAISSFILMGQYNPFIAFLNQVIEPFVGPFRKLNLQVGMLDLSFIIAIFAIYFLKDFLLFQTIGHYVNYIPGLFIG